MKNAFEYEAELAALREDLAGYKQGAKVEADAADEARQLLKATERRNAEAEELLHDASIHLARWITPKESPRKEIIAFLSKPTESGASDHDPV